MKFNILIKKKEEKPYEYFIRCRKKKTVNKIQHPFMIKNYQQPGNKMELP